ncbi:MAG: 30S ribosomal protein S1 [Candidatus Melainabacteria bacterium]
MLTSAVLEPSQEMRDSFAQLLEKSFEMELKPGAIVVGEVVRLDKDGLMVDIGGKSEGFAPMKELPGCRSSENLQAEYKVGQVLEFFIINDVDGDDVQYILSVRRVNMLKNWDKLIGLKDAGETVEVTVTGTTKGGVIVNILGFKGFIPASQLRVAKTLAELVGDLLPAKILEVDQRKNKLILSHREAIFAQKAALRAETIATLNEGDVVSGEVVKITDFGAFVDINGIDGLLPLSEITWRRIQHPSEVLELGQKLTVTVLTVDQRLQRISLSLKRLESDPWDTVNDLFNVGQQLDGRISKLLGSGLLAELHPGIEAYCAYGNQGPFYNMGDLYRFEIVSINPVDRRITLSYVGEAQPVML